MRGGQSRVEARNPHAAIGLDQGREHREAAGSSGQVLVEQLDRGFEGHDQDDRGHQRCDRVQRSSHQPEETERPHEREREHRQWHQHPGWDGGESTAVITARIRNTRGTKIFWSRAMYDATSTCLDRGCRRRTPGVGAGLTRRGAGDSPRGRGGSRPAASVPRARPGPRPYGHPSRPGVRRRSGGSRAAAPSPRVSASPPAPAGREPREPGRSSSSLEVAHVGGRQDLDRRAAAPSARCVSRSMRSRESRENSRSECSAMTTTSSEPKRAWSVRSASRSPPPVGIMDCTPGSIRSVSARHPRTTVSSAISPNASRRRASSAGIRLNAPGPPTPVPRRDRCEASLASLFLIAPSKALYGL